MIPEALEEPLARIEAAGELGRVKAIYLVPYFDNPAGVTMPLERRAADCRDRETLVAGTPRFT